MRFWRRTHSSSRTTTRRSFGAACPPRLEALEDRTLLAAGTLDPGFGTGGMVMTALQASGTPTIRAVARQQDGKFVAATTITMSSGAVVARYNADGTYDISFGDRGVASSNLTRSIGAVGVAVQPDGKIVVGGNSGFGFGAIRLNADGTPDTGFGTGGGVSTQFPRAAGIAVGMILLPDGSIAVYGGLILMFPPGSSTRPAIVRYTANGTLAGGFGQDSVSPVAALVQRDGKIVFAGSRIAGSGPTDFGLVRFLAGGQLDASFGTGGIVTTDFSGDDSASALLIQPDGQLVAAGRSGSNIALARYGADGALDTTFGDGGRVITPSPICCSAGVSTLTLQQDGKLVAGGGAGTPTRDFALARYNPNGTLDVRFGTNGTTVTDFGASDAMLSLYPEPGGKLLAAGSSTSESQSVTSSSFVLARYLGDDANEGFLVNAYQDLLKRPADPVGWAMNLAFLRQGGSRTQVAQAITTSAEYRTLVVRDLYVSFLGRDAEPAGLSAHVSFLAGGGTVAQLKATILGSAEYYERRGQSTNDGFLNVLYVDVLGRTPDPAGREGFTQALNMGVTRTTVASVVVGSQEALERLTRGWYTRFLRRPAEPAGQQAFVAALQGGMRDEVAISIIVGSDEYADRL